ncbi:MAG: aldo/keto reductase [Clostridia bacterium]
MQSRINQKNGDDLSILGFGCMRFPTKNGEIDEEKSTKLILTAIENKINYFDTAYIYHNGKSESFLGKVLAENNLRQKVKIATKLPPFFVRSKNDIEKIFKKQLSRLQTDYIDYYLIHMLGDIEGFNRLCDLGLLKWIEDKKKNGEIRNIGFSFHGGREQFSKLIMAYDWDFTQLQFNYLDVNNQASIKGVKLAYEMGIPVFVMEPLRGGKLAENLPPKLLSLWEETNKSPVENALDFIWNMSEVNLLLSGMSSMHQLTDNISYADKAEINMLSSEELSRFDTARNILLECTKVPCTGCGYCLPCPYGVAIPTCFSCYNDSFVFKTKSYQYIRATGAMSKSPGNASNCKSCLKCVLHCPQGINIPKELSNVSKKFEKFPFSIFTYFAKKFF